MVYMHANRSTEYVSWCSPSWSPPSLGSRDTSCSKKAEDDVCSDAGTSVKMTAGVQNSSNEKHSGEALDEAADMCKRSELSSSPFRRHRGVQSSGAAQSKSPSSFLTKIGEQVCPDSRSFSHSPAHAPLKTQDTSPYHAGITSRGKEEGISEKDPLPQLPTSFTYRGRQATIPYAEVQAPLREKAPRNYKAARLERLAAHLIGNLSSKKRKNRLRVTLLSAVAILLFAVVLPPLFREACSRGVYVRPSEGGLLQKCKEFGFLSKVGAAIEILISELGGRLVFFLLEPVGEISKLGLWAASLCSVGLPHTGRWVPEWLSSSPEKNHWTMPALPTAKELRQEFPQYGLGRVPATEALRKHSEEFKKEIIQVTEGVHVAVGFGLANCVIINAPEGIILVDTMESTAAMEAVWRAWLDFPFRQRPPPLKAIIYTHFHTDHVFGAAAVVQPDTEVHAHWLTHAEMSKVFTLTAGITYRRSMRQFGVFVKKYDFVNAGIGPALRYNSGEEIGTVLPTHIMYDERKKLDLAGMQLELIHAPGESKDQLLVWLPEKKVLIGADNVYKSMPNIYAIRGTETRDCSYWVASLDMMRSLKPEFLVLGHTRPLTGREYIASTLLAYRDAIQFIHDQTLRYMNKGYYANDIAHMVKLPPHLESHPFLQPFYGTVPWAVKAIFTHYMGWFSGNPEDLAVASTQEKAETFLSLAGNVQNLLAHALKNLREGHVQRALEFASAAHHVAPASTEAKTLKILALRAAAAKQQAATGRNWFLTAALESEGHAELRLSDSQKRQTLSKLTMQQVFELLPVRLVPERAHNLECVLEFHFTDVDEHACVHYRRGIAYQKWPCEKTADVVATTTREVWLGILNKDRSPALAVATGDLRVSGSLRTLARALLCVELEAN
ncbi:linear primary-alkylsulfatase-like [Ochotona princeps]|uniref:linear primary-alkylsulfatase-like n=1 Tax=Ochotona princeps TaxID=9978 RepID=UPI002715293C|nr:linear primary-alkylsulfatase-like [Ochotona princeps]